MQYESRPFARPLRPAWLGAFALAAGVMLVQPAAAFTVEGGDASWTPKFNLEEQARQFRNPNSNALPGAGGVDVPGGKVQFGVQRDNPAFGSGYEFGASRAGRQHYDRLFDPSYQFNGR